MFQRVLELTKKDSAGKTIRWLTDTLWTVDKAGERIWFREGKEPAPDPEEKEIRHEKNKAVVNVPKLIPYSVAAIIGGNILHKENFFILLKCQQFVQISACVAYLLSFQNIFELSEN